MIRKTNKAMAITSPTMLSAIIAAVTGHLSGVVVGRGDQPVTAVDIQRAECEEGQRQQ